MIQTMIVTGFLFTTSVQVSDLGLGAEIPAHPGLTTLGYLFTVVALIGLINAFNLIDGLDGLASGLAVIALAGIGLAATIAGYPEYALSIIVMVTPMMVFWLANLGLIWCQAQDFPGRRGRHILGFLVGVALIQSSQAPVAIIEPVFVVWCVAVPVIDTLQVMYHRLKDGRSIFDSDRLHLHYRLVDAGYSKHRVVAVMLAGNAVVVGLGLGSDNDLTGAVFVCLRRARGRLRQLERAPDPDRVDHEHQALTPTV